ncbi:MAG TPA: phosphotransferase [Actinomycetes bacterium]|nr:phosphotransferase [Actinomycetes bacterium]
MAEGEVWLAGNVGGVMRIDDTVRRPVGRWTPAVHALLSFLAPRVPSVPRVRGLDGGGREVLDFMPGRVIDPKREVLTDGQLVSLVSWTRKFHDAVLRFDHSGPWRYFPIRNATLIGHNDIAPYNACFDGDELVGVFDWDMAGPTNPPSELAFVAWNCVPLWRDVGASAAAGRLSLIARTYGGFTAEQILLAVPERIGAMIDGIPVAADAGDIGMANLVAQGEPDRSRVSLAGLVARIPDILVALT